MAEDTPDDDKQNNMSEAPENASATLETQTTAQGDDGIHEQTEDGRATKPTVEQLNIHGNEQLSHDANETLSSSALISGGNASAAVPNGFAPLLTEPLIASSNLDTEPILSGGHVDPWDESAEASQGDGTHSAAASADYRIQAFAKIEFDDGDFYMNTYAVEFGRDIRAVKGLSKDGKRRRRRASSGGRSGGSQKSKRDQEHGRSGTVVSESGGIMGYDPPASSSEERTSRAHARSGSTSSQQPSRRSSMHAPKVDEDGFGNGSLANPNSSQNEVIDITQRPPPDVTPLIPIHPPVDAKGNFVGHGAVSRKHIRISFNFTRDYFELHILGRNGAFLDDEFHAAGEVEPLVSGSMIQIGNIRMRFVLPDVPPGETGAETDNAGNLLSDGEDGEGLSVGADVNGIQRGGKAKPPLESDLPKPKRKGPGRPPKNGIISKREQALLARQARENAQAVADQNGKSGEVRGKGKTAKQLELEAQNRQPSGKRKYTKRKRAGADIEQQIQDSTEQTDSVPPEHAITAKTVKEKSKPIKPPRSPSPVFDEATLTPEQLAKPQASYVILIHEALSNSKTGQMSLPQIYRAIERRYPFFKLRVQTQGWQSSVRHNLSQHPAFKKIERDGKGWMWGLVPEVSIEKEKKRRATPPPQPQQHYYPQPNYPQNPYAYPSMATNNGQTPSYPYPIPSRLPYPSALGPGGFALPFAKPASESTYKSPYDSATPAAPASAPQAASHDAEIKSQDPTTAEPVAQPSTSNADAIEASKEPAKGSELNPLANDSKSEQREDVLSAVDKFKIALISSMDDKDHAEKIVNSAVEKTLQKSNPESAGAEEKAIMIAVSNMISTLGNQSSGETNADSKTPNLDETATSKKGSSVAEIAADIANQIPLTNGDKSPSPREDQIADKRSSRKAPEIIENTRVTRRKRPLEQDTGDDIDEGRTTRRESKRTAPS